MLSLLSWAAFATLAGTPSQPCTKHTAIPASIEAIMADQMRYRGKCVSVDAITNGNLLFTSIEGYYRAGPLIGGDPERNPDDRERLGLDNPAIMSRLPDHGLHRLSAVGRVQDCEVARDAMQASVGPGEIAWISGFCHYANGPYLWLKGVKDRGPVNSPRLIGEGLRRKVGNLVEAPTDWRFRPYVEQLVARYLSALRTGDRATFASIHLENEKPVRQSSAVKLAFGPHPGFRALRRGKNAPQIAIFVERDGPRASSATILEGGASEAGDYSSTACFCTADDCTGRWPISDIDADNRTDRPYVCARLTPYLVFQKGTFPAFWTEQGHWGLAEPRVIK